MRIRGAAVAILLGFAGVAGAGDEAPGWLKEAAAAAVPRFEKKVSADVLLKMSRNCCAQRQCRVPDYAARPKP